MILMINCFFIFWLYLDLKYMLYDFREDVYFLYLIGKVGYYCVVLFEGVLLKISLFLGV